MTRYRLGIQANLQGHQKLVTPNADGLSCCTGITGVVNTTPVNSLFNHSYMVMCCCAETRVNPIVDPLSTQNVVVTLFPSYFPESAYTPKECVSTMLPVTCSATTGVTMFPAVTNTTGTGRNIC